MKKAIRNGKIYENGTALSHCHYMKDGFVFDHQQAKKYPKLIMNGQKVRV